MDEPFLCVKYFLLNFKLNNCCYFAPVRIGLLLTGYFNIIYDIASIIGISDESYSPIIMLVEASLLEDNATQPVPILCYSAELMFSIVLLCSVYRNDVYLMKVYTIFGVTALVVSILFYSVVIVAIGAFMKIAMVLSILFQLYVLLLVRSMIVEIKQTKKNREMPPILMSTLLHGKRPLIVHDAETQVELEGDHSLSATLEYRPWNTNENIETLLEKSKKESELFDKVKLETKVDVPDVKKDDKSDICNENEKGTSEVNSGIKVEIENKETKIEIIDEKTKQEKGIAVEVNLEEKEKSDIDKESETVTVVEKPKKRRWFTGRSKHEDKSPNKKEKDKHKNLETIEEKPKE